MILARPDWYWAVLTVWALLAPVTFFVLMKTTAPYGRFVRPGWGWRLPDPVGWVVMESPAVLVFAWGFAAGQRKDLVAVVFCALFCGHYLYRSLLYPLLRRSKTAMPLAIVASGLAFNCVNGSLQAGYLFSLAPAYPVAWLLDVRFLAGLPVFVAGFAIHFRADAQLIALRRTRQGKYVMPRGALFGWISCPNYFGELIEWVGWALLTWSWAGAAFALWTAANLVPRALAYHRWYQQTFADYPPARRAIIPLVL